MDDNLPERVASLEARCDERSLAIFKTMNRLEKSIEEIKRKQDHIIEKQAEMDKSLTRLCNGFKYSKEYNIQKWYFKATVLSALISTIGAIISYYINYIAGV